MGDKKNEQGVDIERVLNDKIDRLEQWLLDDSAQDEVASSSAASSSAEIRPAYSLHPLLRRATQAPADHSGHRKRMRRTASRGLEGMSDIQLVELLLSYVVPRKDTNPIAHRLLDKFETVAGIMRASVGEIVSVGSITLSAAKLLTTLGRLYVWNGVREVVLSSPSDAADFFGSLFIGDNTDGAYVAYLDARYRLIVVETFDGYPPISACIGSACKYDARTVIIARRDKSEFPDDFELTDYVDGLSEALDSIDVKLADNMIFTDHGYYTVRVPVDAEWQARYIFVPTRVYSRAPELGRDDR